ncbi:MAG: OmpA family protein [Pseudomonadota bacterium]
MTTDFARWCVLGCAAVLVLAAGCAGVPESEVLDQARAEFSVADEQDRMYDFASRPMNQARQHLRRAEELQAAGERLELIEHEAVMARQYVALAEAQTQRGLTQEEIDQADRRRQALLLEMEEQRAGEASQRAAAAESELEAARAELAHAEERARNLSETVSELEVAQDERGTVFTLSDVVFDFDSAELNEGGRRTLARIADTLSEYPEGRILVEGYTDSVGDDEYNQSLSERRARSVRDAFIDQGIDPQRIRAEGHGESYPVASNDTAEGRQLNRRVEIVVASGGEEPQGRAAAVGEDSMQ